MNESKSTVSKRLEQVRAWKDAIWREVQDLPTAEAVQRVLAESHSAAREMRQSSEKCHPDKPLNPRDP